MRPEVSIYKAADNTESDANNVSDTVVYIGAAVKGGLDDLNHSSEDARPHKHWEQSKAASSGEGEGKCCKGNDVYKFVAAVWRWRRLVYWPKHGNRQDGGYNQRQRNIEILAHYARLVVIEIKRNK